MDVFVKQMLETKNEVMKIMKDKKEIIMTANDWHDFKTSTKCYICGEKYKEGDKRVRDHCHFTGQYRGSAHDDCNLRFSLRFYKIPVFLHNLKNYRRSLNHRESTPTRRKHRHKCNSTEQRKIYNLRIRNLCFKDSFSFLSASLDKLVKLTKYEEGEKRENWRQNLNTVKETPMLKHRRTWIY